MRGVERLLHSIPVDLLLGRWTLLDFIDVLLLHMMTMMRWHRTRIRRRNKKNAILLPQKKNPKTKIKMTSRVETGDKKTGTTGLS